jgi:hypothetical protein
MPGCASGSGNMRGRMVGRCVEIPKLAGAAGVSTEVEKLGGKTALDAVAADAKRLADEAAIEERQAQMDLLEPLSAEELAEAQEALGREAGPMAVMRHARETRKGRPKGSRNRRTSDTIAYLSQFGPDPGCGDDEDHLRQRGSDGRAQPADRPEQAADVLG